MILAAVGDSTARMHDLASLIAQIVPVLLFAGLAVPLVARSDEDEPSTGSAAWREWAVTAGLLGAAFFTECVALACVFYPIRAQDAPVLVWSLVLTAIIACYRVLMPLTRHMAHETGTDEKTVWRAAFAWAFITFGGALAWVMLRG